MELLHCYTSCLQVICAIRHAATVALLCAHGGCMPVVFASVAVCYQPCSQRFGVEGGMTNGKVKTENGKLIARRSFLQTPPPFGHLALT